MIMLQSRTAILAAITTALLGTFARGGEIEVKLTVREPAGAARKSAPASGGVPLPWGVFKKDQVFSLHDGGRAVPAQITPLVVDEKGFLRWVLVDTQVDLAAKGTKELTLRATPGSAAPASPLKVSEAGGGVIIDTGKIKLAIDKSAPFGLFAKVEAGGKAVVTGGEASYTEGGKTYKASAPESIEVEYSGPMRATVCVRGRFDGDEKSKLLYVARVTAWAGRSDVHVKYSLSSSNPDHYCYRKITDSTIRLNLDGGPADATGGADGVAAGGVYACDLYFEEDKPRGLAVEKGALVLRGVAAAGDGRWLMDCSHLSSQYVIDFAGAGEAAAARGWLHLACEPAWYSETGGFSIGKFGTQADEIKCYETWKWQHNPGSAPKTVHRKMGTGRYKLYEDNHFETEQDNTECLLLMYLRTGSRSFLDRTQAWANFEMDTQKWRTDGWRWKDGGVWWRNGPYGNRPQREPDPASGKRGASCGKLNMSKQCYCHSYGAGLAGWFCITGDRDALEAAIDSVEQNYDTQKRTKDKAPGQMPKRSFGRDYTRSCRVANAVRLVAPQDEFVREASDWMVSVYLQRPIVEPRGLVPWPKAIAPYKGENAGALVNKLVGERGQEEMKKHGVTMDHETGELTDTKTGAKWFTVQDPQFYHYAPLPPAMENYWQITGNEDAHDWVIACGQALSRVIFQKHANFAHYHSALLVDFPVKGVALDKICWQTDEGNKWGDGFEMSGYTACFWPDSPARAYALTGEPILKQRAYDYWNGGSHRGYRAKEMRNLGSVAMWVNVYGVHAEQVRYNSRTFYEHAHPRKDAEAPAAVKDLSIAVAGGDATVSFTAPADAGGGKVVRYQVKCSDKPIVDYEEFLKAWAAGKGDTVTNWWMAANLEGEPAPKAPGAKESFTVTGVPAGAKYFTVRSFDDSSNRSALGNVAGGK